MRISSFVLSVVIVLGCVIPAVAVSEETSVLCDTNVGDVNNDGKINVSDASVMLKYIAKWDVVNIDTDKADVANDDKISLSDVSLLLKHIAKWKSVRLGHNDEQNIIVKATCLDSGESLLICKLCGSEKTVYTAVVPCDLRIGETREATCDATGYTRYYCGVCFSGYSEIIPATEKHTYSGGRCTVCGKLEYGYDGDSIIYEAQLEVLRLVNIEREKAGVQPLGYYDAGQASADIRADEVSLRFSHTRPDGRDCFTVFDDAGIFCGGIGENIAFGYATPEEVVEAWMSSPGHRANILCGEYTHIVVGVKGDVGVQGANVSWVQLFLENPHTV